MKSKFAHFGPFLRIFLRTFLIIFMRILVIIRDYHPKPTPTLKPRHLVSKRQRAGTLEKVVKYDKEAFDKAWAWMASSPSDDEEE